MPVKKRLLRQRAVIVARLQVMRQVYMFVCAGNGERKEGSQRSRNSFRVEVIDEGTEE
jgi:hypothetical protein